MYFINEIVEWELTKYLWTGCTKVALRDQIMSHAVELVRQMIRKQRLHTIYPGQEDSAFGDLLQTAWVQIEKTLYKYRARPHCRRCFNADRPLDSLLYSPNDDEYGIKNLDEVIAMHHQDQCPKCGLKLTNLPYVEPCQGRYGGTTTILYRGYSKVFNMWCVAPSTMVPTCHGPLPASQILEHFEAGLPIHVQGLDGLALVEAMKVRELTDTVVITTENGYNIECSPEHQFYAYRDDAADWPEAKDLQIGDCIAIQYNQQSFADYSNLNDIILVRRGDWCPPSNVTNELAYIVGLFLADGSCSYGKLAIYTVDQEIIEKLVSNTLGLNFIHEASFQRVSLCNVRFIEFLQVLGFPEHTSAETKKIPDRLLCWPQSMLKSLLSGMYDGDGHSLQKTGTIGYTSTSPILIAQLRMLLLNFGIISKVSNDKRSHREFSGHASSVKGAVQLLLSTIDSARFYGEIGFGLSRKQTNRFKLRPARRMLYGLNERFRILYRRYGIGRGHYDKLRRLLSSNKCTIEAAQYGLENWSEHTDDQDFEFVNQRVGEYLAQRDNLIWLPIKSITSNQSELIDMAVDAPSHSYVANGMVVHNSQIARTVILAFIKKEGRDRKNSSSYTSHLGAKSKPVSGILTRFLEETRELWKFHVDYLTIIDAIGWLFQNDERPQEGIIGKLVDRTGLSRSVVTDFIKVTRLRSFELSDSNLNRGTSESKIDKRKGATEFEDEP